MLIALTTLIVYFAATGNLGITLRDFCGGVRRNSELQAVQPCEVAR